MLIVKVFPLWRRGGGVSKGKNHNRLNPGRQEGVLINIFGVYIISMFVNKYPGKSLMNL